MIDAALAYADLGWPVLPLEPRGKRPLGRLVPRGLHDATTVPAVIRSWWRRVPEANVALVTGVAFDVIDIDGREGLASFERLRARRPMPPGPTAITGGGGWHALVAPTGLGNRAGLVAGVDYRGRGGYIVAPPSVHGSGRRYRWCSDGGPYEPIPAAPSWLLDVLTPPRPEPRPVRAVVVADRYVRAAFDAEVAKVRSAVPGTRNHMLNAAAFSLGQLVGDGVLDAGMVEEALLDAAVSAGLGGREARRTITSGLTGGQRNPRRAIGVRRGDLEGVSA